MADLARFDLPNTILSRSDSNNIVQGPRHQRVLPELSALLAENYVVENGVAACLVIAAACNPERPEIFAQFAGKETRHGRIYALDFRLR